MRKTLQPFQELGAKFLTSHQHALLADEPGLGKTIQALAASERLGLQKILVVCPASVRMNWWQELVECRVGGVWSVISYEQAVKGKAEFSTAEGVDAIILDEGHFLKTATSQRTQAIFKNKDGLARRARYKWVLTGTPILNRPREMWPVLKCLNPRFANMPTSYFEQRYCGAYFDGRAVNARGASRLDELRGLLGDFMLRRTKEEVMAQLPARIVTRVPVTVSVSERAAIEAAENEILDREAKLSSAAEDFSQLGDLAKLLRVTGLAKIVPTVTFVEELLETEEKVVVFTRHRDVLSALRDIFRTKGFAPTIYQGGMADVEKKDAVDYFVNSKECRVFIANIQAAGTGINGLQLAASSVVFAELSWVPGEMSQAIDRLHRIGQKAAAVNAYLLHAPGTMESAVLAVQNAKGSVIGKLMGEQGWRS